MPRATNGPNHNTKPGLAILALASGGFTIGTTEFVTMGVLPQIADGIGVGVPTAGHVISMYALGVVIGVPILAFYGAALPRRALLLALMGAYGAFNLVSALASSYPALAVSRLLTGLPHGAYFGVASLVAASLVPENRRGRAVASVMLGLSVANVVGVPTGTWLGQNAGWRIAYLLCALLALLTLVMIVAWVRPSSAPDRTDGRSEARSFFSSPQVWLTMAVGAIGFGGIFAIYSYIAKSVTVVGGLPEGAVPIFVFALGLGMVVGTPIAGEMARWSVGKSLGIGALATVIVMLVLWLVMPAGWWALPVVFAVTGCGSLVVITLQLRLMDVAGDAVTLGAAMNHAALNIANALGAWLGGVAIAAGYGYRSTALVGAALAATGVLLLGWSAALSRRAVVARQTV